MPHPHHEYKGVYPGGSVGRLWRRDTLAALVREPDTVSNLTERLTGDRKRTPRVKAAVEWLVSQGLAVVSGAGFVSTGKTGVREVPMYAATEAGRRRAERTAGGSLAMHPAPEKPD